MDSSVFVPVQTQPPPTVDNTSGFFGNQAVIDRKQRELDQLREDSKNGCNKYCTVS